MAFLLGTQQLEARAGIRILFREITVGVQDGARIGILGPNGAGKSTLMRLLAGPRNAASGVPAPTNEANAEPYSGQVTVTGGVNVAYLHQADVLDPEKTIAEVVHPGRAVHEWAADGRLREIHAGLLPELSHEQKIGELSGGQRRRVALAAVLAADAQVLLLDEPTNHLDVEGVAWLAAYLNKRCGDRGALLVITHDRWFLDQVCTNIWELVPGVDPGNNRPQEPGHLEFYEGGYNDYIMARAERARQAAVAAQKRDNLLRKELAWLRRGAPARTSKPRYRIEEAEALIADVPPPRDSVELLKMASARLGKQVIDLVDVTFTYEDEPADLTGIPDERPDTTLAERREYEVTGRKILDNVTYRLAPGERLGIVGVNGAGKTTLLRLFEGSARPVLGHRYQGKTVELAVLSQSTHELDEVSHLRVVEAVAQVKQSMVVGDKELTASQLVERLGFTKSRAWTPVKDISGGERRRLQLLRLLMREPNVLLMDEPTNDLDTDTLAAMEDLLDSFPGTLVIVSHDRYLLERVTDHQVALLGEGKIRDLPGGIEQYLQLRAQSAAAPTGKGNPGPDPAPTALPASAEGSAAARRAAKKEVEKIERAMAKLQAQREKLQGQLEELAVQAAPDTAQLQKMAELSKEIASLDEQLAEQELAWMEAAETLDSLGG